MDSSGLQLDKTPDLVLLETLSEEAVVGVLGRRYKDDKMYTFIGPVLICVNPFQLLKKDGIQIYDKKFIKDYEHKVLPEMDPHIFASAEQAFRGLLEEREAQCITISGESGAGKTEAAKQIMSYISAVSGGAKGTRSEQVKTVLMQSNPLLEAMGNALTVRNNNSSRFGKYQELVFDFKGEVVGAHTRQYLLEKSRVIQQAPSERNYHIFYALCAGATPEQKEAWRLRPAESYAYLSHEERSIPDVDETKRWREVCEALDALSFEANVKTSVFRLLSLILSLGDIEFTENDDNNASVDPAQASNLCVCAELLGVKASSLAEVLCTRTLSVRHTTHVVPLNAEQAGVTRDTLAKALYHRIFTTVLETINKASAPLQSELQGARTTTLGILDIYGFEIFDNNSLEQLCINYVNEKLQQMFIELTLKAEQEEYVSEGLEWKPVEFFNNQVVCDLIEAKGRSLFALMDEQCAISESDDGRLLSKFHSNFAGHAHYHKPKMAGIVFTIKHFAGDVAYNVDGFIEKNRDTLFNDVVELCAGSSDDFVRLLFEDKRSEDEKRHRPPTALAQFKGSVATLMKTLNECNPHYVRCIKPNENKRPREFDVERVTHQVRYLGLVENIRVRRAGFCSRQTFARFMRRYKMVAPETWPHWVKEHGAERTAADAAACTKLLTSPSVNYTVLSSQEDAVAGSTCCYEQGADFQCGKTKVFIRSPAGLFGLEALRAAAIVRLVDQLTAYRRMLVQYRWYKRYKAATRVNAGVRRFLQRRWYLRYVAATRIAALYRTHAAERRYSVARVGLQRLQATHRMRVDRRGHEKLRLATTRIQASWKGLQYRRKIAAEEPDTYNTCYVAQLTMKAAVRKYMGKKSRRRVSLLNQHAGIVAGDLLDLGQKKNVLKMLIRVNQKNVCFDSYVQKLNRKFKWQKRILLLSDDFVFYLKPNVKSPKELRKVPIAKLSGVSLSLEHDNYIVLHVKDEYDWVFQTEHKIELLGLLRKAYRSLRRERLPVNFTNEIEYKIKSGATKRLTFSHASSSEEGNRELTNNANNKKKNNTSGGEDGDGMLTTFVIDPKDKSHLKIFVWPEKSFTLPAGTAAVSTIPSAVAVV